MINKFLFRSITIIGLIACSHSVLSQELNPATQEYIEDNEESSLEGSDGETDISDLTDDLIFFYQHPLNLNMATREELGKLRMLNDYQIEALIDYRKNNRSLQSIYELLYVPGFSEQNIEMLTPFVTCNAVVQKFRLDSNLFKHNENELLLRWQRIVEKQQGYLPVPDSILKANPDKSRYLGSPNKMYLRYRFSLKNQIKGGFLAENDAGEEFFAGSNHQGFDFYSAHLLYSNNNTILQSFAVGDYHVHTGQGLLLWSSFSVGKSSYVSNLCKRSSLISGNISAEENKFLRGAAFTLGRKSCSLTIFGSFNKIDASIADSTQEDHFFNGFIETGNHNTPAELKKENYLAVKTYGAIARYERNKLKLGLNALYTAFSKSLLSGNELYKAHSFAGMELSGFSTDYRFLAGITQIFGETAFSNNSIASLNGLLFLFKPNLNVGAVYRYYQPDYYSYYANAFCEGSNVSNENGFFLTGEFQFSDNRIKFYGDVFSFPWLKYRVNAPSDGNEFSFEAGRKIQKTDLYFRFKRQEKPINYLSDANIEEIRPYTLENYRLNAIYQIGSKIRMQSRIEVSKAGFQGENKSDGYLLSQDIGWQNETRTVEISMRVDYFNAVNYNARLYAYEKDLLYANSIQMFYGKGWRYAVLFKWMPAKFIAIWLKIGRFEYPGDYTIGSGLDTIDANHKTEIKMQSVFNF